MVKTVSWKMSNDHGAACEIGKNLRLLFSADFCGVFGSCTVPSSEARRVVSLHGTGILHRNRGSKSAEVKMSVRKSHETDREFAHNGAIRIDSI